MMMIPARSQGNGLVELDDDHDDDDHDEMITPAICLRLKNSAGLMPRFALLVKRDVRFKRARS